MDSIEIRLYNKNDVDGFYEAVIQSKNELSKWFPWCHDEYSKDESEHWIKTEVLYRWESKTGYEFIITDPIKNKVLGGCGLEQINLVKHDASLGYWVRSDETGQGIATKACHFLLKYAFSTLNLETIKVICSTENIGSQKVVNKLPYDHKQIVTNGFQIRNSISDAMVFTITRESFYNCQQ